MGDVSEKRPLVYKKIKESNNTEWISVKDKLPKKYQQVLTYGDTSNGGFHIQQCEYSDGIFRFSESQKEHKGYITHWKELPKLPTN